MTLEFATLLLNASPFVPFELFLADGRKTTVMNPELAMIGADSRSLAVFLPPHTNEFIDLALVVSVLYDDASASA
jgi:hypothetical protein